jgi:hypothetical protein
MHILKFSFLKILRKKKQKQKKQKNVNWADQDDTYSVRRWGVIQLYRSHANNKRLKLNSERIIWADPVIRATYGVVPNLTERASNRRGSQGQAGREHRYPNKTEKRKQGKIFFKQ